jgi:hypothetical protein
MMAPLRVIGNCNGAATCLLHNTLHYGKHDRTYHGTESGTELEFLPMTEPSNNKTMTQGVAPYWIIALKGENSTK